MKWTAIFLMFLPILARSQDAPYFNRSTKQDQDVGALNQNFRDLTDRTRNNLDFSMPVNLTCTSTQLLAGSVIAKGMVQGTPRCVDISSLSTNVTSSTTSNGNLFVTGQLGVKTFSPAFDVDIAGSLHALFDVQFDQSLTVSGAVTAGSFAGSGSALTALNASQLTSGTVPNARLDSSSVTLQGNAFNGASQLIQTTSASKYPALDGSLILRVSSVAAGAVGIPQLASSIVYGGTITANASQFSGTGDAGNVLSLLSSSVTLRGNSFNGGNQLVLLDAGGVFNAAATIRIAQSAAPTLKLTESGGGNHMDISYANILNGAIFETSNRGFQFKPAGNPGLTIDNSGNVGVGGAPTAALEVMLSANSGSGFKKPRYTLAELNTSTPTIVGVEVMGPSPTYDTYIGTGTSTAASWLNSRTQTYP